MTRDSQALDEQWSWAHEVRQKQRSDWPTLTATLSLIAEGRLAVDATELHPDGSPRVLVDRKPLPFGGVDVVHAPPSPEGASA